MRCDRTSFQRLTWRACVSTSRLASVVGAWAGVASVRGLIGGSVLRTLVLVRHLLGSAGRRRHRSTTSRRHPTGGLGQGSRPGTAEHPGDRLSSHKGPGDADRVKSRISDQVICHDMEPAAARASPTVLSVDISFSFRGRDGEQLPQTVARAVGAGSRQPRGSR